MNWDGFRIIDISDPDNPTEVSRTFCDGNQGDVAVWDNILVRAWNTPAGTSGAFGAGTTCDDNTPPAEHAWRVRGCQRLRHQRPVQPRPGGERGDAVRLSHPHHRPDLDNDRVLVYSDSSSAVAGCTGIDIIEVPIDDPSAARYLRLESSGGPGDQPAPRSCHDSGVILGDEMKLACAGGNGSRPGPSTRLMGITDGSRVPLLGRRARRDDRAFRRLQLGRRHAHLRPRARRRCPGRVRSHRRRRQEVVLLPRFEHRSQARLLLLPRNQSSAENCTLHNYNVVPLRDGDDVLVHVSDRRGRGRGLQRPRQHGRGRVERPAPIPTPPGSPFCAPVGCEIGSDWSTYWYNNFIYESSITEGFNVFRFSGPQTAGAMRLGHLNPNTQSSRSGSRRNATREGLAGCPARSSRTPEPAAEGPHGATLGHPAPPWNTQLSGTGPGCATPYCLDFPSLPEPTKLVVGGRQTSHW